LGGQGQLDQAAAFADAKIVFAYGSQARGDFEAGSDLELGVVGRTGSGASAARFLEALGLPKDVRAYSFDLARLQDADPDVPFTRRVFVAELVFSAHSIVGPALGDIIPVPTLRPSDLAEEHAMARARLVDAMLAARAGQAGVAAHFAWKATFMAARVAILAATERLVSNRDDLRTLHWAPDLAPLVAWMDFRHCQQSLLAQPESIRVVIDVVTGPLFGRIKSVAQAFVPKP
jgi:hypothetical protein